MQLNLTAIIVLSLTVVLSFGAGIVLYSFKKFDAFVGTILGVVGFAFEVLFGLHNAYIFFGILGSTVVVGILLSRFFRLREQKRKPREPSLSKSKEHGQ